MAKNNLTDSIHSSKLVPFTLIKEPEFIGIVRIEEHIIKKKFTKYVEFSITISYL